MSPVFELGPATLDPDSPLPRFSCRPESLSGSSRFRLRVVGPDRDEPPLVLSSLSDSTRMGSFVVSMTLGVEACEGGTDEGLDLDRELIVSNRRWASRRGRVNNREDGPVGIGPTLDGGGDVCGGEAPGRAYSSVQCLALLSCCFLFLTYSVAIEGTSGSCGFGSVSMDERDKMTLNIDRAGDHWFLRISMQTEPRSDMFMWYIRVKKRIFGAENG